MKLASKHHCSGCSACHDACPKNAIVMVADEEGFLYPRIDEAKCVRCGLCEKVCPSLNRDLPRTPLAVYAAKAKDDELRLKSSSGGVFSLLAQQVLARGGVVYGAGFDHADWHVMHKSAENENELGDLRGSKYVQSDVRGIYASVRSQLISDREVLFSGTPCQVAGLRRYLNILKVDVSKLLLVDVVCHAVPSPLAWRKYLDERLAKTGPGAIIRRIAFRHKNCGWKRYSLSLCFADDKEYRCDLREDTFLRGFLSELYNRPSCHDCQCRELRSGSDLTIADYWSVHEKFPEMDDDCGTSLVLVNTDFGRSRLDAIGSQVSLVESDFSDAVRVNQSIVRSSGPHLSRTMFFKRLDKAGESFDCSVFKLLEPPIYKRVRAFCGRILRVLRLR